MLNAQADFDVFVGQPFQADSDPVTAVASGQQADGHRNRTSDRQPSPLIESPDIGLSSSRVFGHTLLSGSNA
jgi:hypothetical protein